MESVNSPTRLYNIGSDDVYFFTGRLEDGTQLLMGWEGAEFVSVEFDAEGNYLSTSAIGFDAKRKDEPNVSIRRYQKVRGLIPGTISVKRFALSERWIGIRDLPDHYQDVLDRPEDFDEEERQILLDDIHLWLEQGDFVLDWDEDYYFDRDGELTSS